MVKIARHIVIDNEAKYQLRQAYNYIKKDSVKSADKVRRSIVASINELVNNPE